MSEIKIKTPNRRSIKWAIRREFEVMAEVDPVFRPGFMSVWRRFIWKFIGLPSLYKRAEGFIAEIDNENVGFTFSYVRPIMMRIDSFLVEPEHRKKGVGTKMVEAIRGFADEYEIRYLVSAIPLENPEGFEYAKKMGFQPYRDKLMQLDDASGFTGKEDEEVLEKLAVTKAKDEYYKWFMSELENGDKWAFELMESEFADLGYIQIGNHWSIMDGKNCVGYLRTIDDKGKMIVYLACEEKYWADEIQFDWIRAAIDRVGREPESMSITFASGGHHEAAKELLKAKGFVEETRQRYLIVKDLGPIEADKESENDYKEE